MAFPAAAQEPVRLYAAISLHAVLESAARPSFETPPSAAPQDEAS
jgi:hypothetical protein